MSEQKSKKQKIEKGIPRTHTIVFGTIPEGSGLMCYAFDPTSTGEEEKKKIFEILEYWIKEDYADHWEVLPAIFLYFESRSNTEIDDSHYYSEIKPLFEQLDSGKEITEKLIKQISKFLMKHSGAGDPDNSKNVSVVMVEIKKLIAIKNIGSWIRERDVFLSNIDGHFKISIYNCWA